LSPVIGRGGLRRRYGGAGSVAGLSLEVATVPRTVAPPLHFRRGLASAVGRLPGKKGRGEVGRGRREPSATDAPRQIDRRPVQRGRERVPGGCVARGARGRVRRSQLAEAAGLGCGSRGSDTARPRRWRGEALTHSS